MTTPADVLKTIKEKEVKFVDLRFTDTRGKEQHVSVPSKVFGMDKFESGHAFDGSSIAGWKGIQSSDMLLMPDANAAYIDPFTDETTLNITCDVVEPSDGKGYERDPRSLAKRADAYLKSTGLGDVAYFGPEPEFFIFDAVEWSIDMSGSYCKIFSSEAPWSSAEKFEGGNMGHRPPVKGGYFPVPPVDSLQDIRSAICLALEQMGVEVEVHHHEVAAAGQNEIGTKFAPLVQRADWLQILKYAVHNTAHAYGKTATVHAEADRRRQRLGNARSPVGVEGRQEPVRGRRLLGPFRYGAVLHRRRDQACESAQRDHQSRDQLVQAARAGIRAPINLAYSRGTAPRDPHPVRGEPEGPAHRGALPDPTTNPYLAFAAMLMAGLDGVQNKIHPGDPVDKNLYDLEPEEAAKVPHPCASLDEALDELDRDRAFLTKGGVFTNDMLDAYIALKMEEVTRFRMTTHPIEYEMYYSL
jgi:glutamine synthetase